MLNAVLRALVMVTAVVLVTAVVMQRPLSFHIVEGKHKYFPSFLF